MGRKPWGLAYPWGLTSGMSWARRGGTRELKAQGPWGSVPRAADSRERLESAVGKAVSLGTGPPWNPGPGDLLPVGTGG